MNAARAMIEEQKALMKPGDQLDVYGRDFREAYPAGFLSIYANSIEAFLGCSIGSAWGTWRVAHDERQDVYRITRHKESDKRYSVDPDRAWMFNRMPDGTLELKPDDEPEIARAQIEKEETP